MAQTKIRIEQTEADVVGPTGATDGNLALFDGATGKLIKDGGAVPAGGGDVIGPATNTADNVPQWDGADSKTLKDGLIITASRYSPTLTMITNLSAVTTKEAIYTRIGNTVTVYGSWDADTSSTGSTSIGISLPIASAFDSGADVQGVIGARGEAGEIYGDVGNARARGDWTAVNTANHGMHFTFSYVIE